MLITCSCDPTPCLSTLQVFAQAKKVKELPGLDNDDDDDDDDDDDNDESTLLPGPRANVTPMTHPTDVISVALTGSSSQSAPAYKPPYVRPGAMTATAHDAARALAKAQQASNLLGFSWSNVADGEVWQHTYILFIFWTVSSGFRRRQWSRASAVGCTLLGAHAYWGGGGFVLAGWC